MSQSADVRSIEAIRRFQAAVAVFREDACGCLSSLELQLKKVLGWLERERPVFWKREIETCYRDMGEARVRLHQCQMRKVGTVKPTCYEEKKALLKAKKDLEYSQKQIPVVKRWCVAAQHESNEYFGRSSQLNQFLERDIPYVLAMLNYIVDRLEAYGNVQLNGGSLPPLPDEAIEAPEQAFDEKDEQ